MCPSEDTPRCIHCLEPITAGAKRCPSCRSWQSRWAADSQNPGLEIAVVAGLALIVAVLVVSWFYMSSTTPANGSPADYLSHVSITSSELEIAKTEQRKFVAVRGTIQNDSDLTLRDFNFKIEFFDKDGTAIDSVDGRLYALVIPPHTESNFKVAHFYPGHDLEHYASHTIEVRHASVVK